MKILVYLNFILTLILIGGFVWLVMYQQKTQQVASRIIQDDSNFTYVDKCGDDCKRQITESVTKAVAALPTSSSKEVTKTVVVTPIPTKAKSQTAYIPIAGPITTTSSDWYDAPGTEFYLNFNTDYGKTAYANWDAFLKVASGVVYARIYDVTNKLAVGGSEVSLSNSNDLKQVISGGLNFWAGNNLYRVQIKSSDRLEVTFGSGRVKIIY